VSKRKRFYRSTLDHRSAVALNARFISLAEQLPASASVLDRGSDRIAADVGPRNATAPSTSAESFAPKTPQKRLTKRRLPPPLSLSLSLSLFPRRHGSLVAGFAEPHAVQLESSLCPRVVGNRSAIIKSPMRSPGVRARSSALPTPRGPTRRDSQRKNARRGERGPIFCSLEES